VPGTFRWWYRLPGEAGTNWGRKQDVKSCWYERELDIPASWKGRRIVLSFDEIDLDAVVFVDGRRIGEVLRPEGGLDLTGHVEPGRHVLRVYVTADYVGVSRSLEEDVWMYGNRLEHVRAWCGGDMKKFRPGRLGLTGSVRLRAVPFTSIEKVLMLTSFRKKEIGAVAWLRSRDGLPGARVGIRVLEDSDGSEAFKATVPIGDVAKGASMVRFAAPWKDFVPWHVGAPHLYRAEICLRDKSGKLVDAYPPITFGFREVWTEGREIMLNGVPFRLRAPWNHAPNVLPNWPFWQGLGCNGLEIQPNPTAWCGWGGRPILNPETLDSADRLGMALLAPAPRVRWLVTRLEDPKIVEIYKRELRLWVQRYGNHPSILGWLIDMNMGSWNDFRPQNIGQPFTEEEKAQRKYWLRPIEIAKDVDPTRLVGYHSGGRPGDFQTGNVYLNFVPLQEREEWLSAWAETGGEPFGVVEFGTPASLNFFKWPYQWLPMYTEYCAIYFGDRAYYDEDDEYVRFIESRPPGGPKPSLTARDLYVPIHYTAYLRLQDLFLRNTIRSWRASGINLGMHFWLFKEGFGRLEDLTGKKGLRYYTWYKGTPDELRRRPVWANAIYDAICQNHQDLLVYLGGKPERFTAKDHSFWAGEKVMKTVVAVWDGLKNRNLDAMWRLEAKDGGAVFAEGNVKLKLEPGDIVKKGFEVAMPKVREKTRAELVLQVREGGKFICGDSMDVQVFPAVKTKAAAKRRWLLFDPAGESAPVLRAVGLSAERYRPGRRLGAGDVLVIGRNALHREKRTVFSADDVARGARVLIMAQRWEPLEALGFRAEDLYSRYVFPRCGQHPVLDGIGAEDLINWRGESGLIAPGPDAERKRLWAHAPHWGSYGNVATVLPETPHAGAFVPVIEAEFDLQYSPLLEWRHGKGTVLFCQLDLTGRVGVDPPATRIARNIVRYLDRAEIPPQDRRVLYVGGDEDWERLLTLGFAARRSKGDELASDLKPGDVVAVGRGGLPEIKKGLGAVAKLVRDGTAVFVLPQTADEMRKDYLPWPVGMTWTEKARASIESAPAVFRGIGPQRLTWRSLTRFDVVLENGLPDGSWTGAGGLLAEIPDGRGRWVFCQVDWRRFEDRKTKNHFRTRWRIRQLYGQILTNLGARSADDVAARVTSPGYFAELAVVSPWKCIGPFKGPEDGASALDTPTPVDKRPLAEGTVEVAGGKKAGWQSFRAVTGGRVPLTWRYMAKPGAVVCAVTYVFSSRERDAVFRLGCEEFMTFHVNGEVIADMRDATPQHRQKATVRGRLKAGWNELWAKIASSGKGLSFTCSVSDPGDLRVAADLKPPTEPPADVPPADALLPDPPAKPLRSLYLEEVESEDDPYGFTPW